MKKTRPTALTVPLIAFIVLSAFTATSAQAFFDATHATEPLIGRQTSDHSFQTDLGTATCKKVEYSGTTSGVAVGLGQFTSETITLHPIFSECVAYGFPASISTVGCNYVYSRTASVGTDVTSGKVAIECESGKQIEIVVVGLCVTTIPAQGPLGTISYTNLTAQGDVAIAASVTGIHYGGSCGSGPDGKTVGSTTLFGAIGPVQVT